MDESPPAPPEIRQNSHEGTIKNIVNKQKNLLSIYLVTENSARHFAMTAQITVASD